MHFFFYLCRLSRKDFKSCSGHINLHHSQMCLCPPGTSSSEMYTYTWYIYIYTHMMLISDRHSSFVHDLRNHYWKIRISYQDHHDSERKQGGGREDRLKSLLPLNLSWFAWEGGREGENEWLSADLLFNFPELCISEHRQQASQGQGAFSVVMQPHLKRWNDQRQKHIGLIT